MIDTPLPPIHRWSDLDGVALTKAEDQLIAAAKAGEPAKIGDTVPTHPTDATLIRAPLLRYLILGGCDAYQMQAAGVQVFGAWIADALDLNFATAAGPIGLFDCHIAKQPQMIQLHVPALVMNRSILPQGLNAQGAQVGGGVFLRGVMAQGEVSLSGAVIIGQLDCEAATLENAEGHALNAQGAQVGGGVFLRGVTAKGEVRLSGAAITGPLVCEGATLENANGYSLQMQRARVIEGFFWRDVKQASGRIDLNSAHVGDLVDDMASWAKCDRITLVGLTYDVLHGTTDVQERITWLKKGARSNGDFHPQPYEQRAKVLRDSGHRAEAAEIMVAKERAQAHARRDRVYAMGPSTMTGAALGNFWRDGHLHVARLWGRSLDVVAGYGHKPGRAVIVLLGLIVLTSLMALGTWRAGDFVPNSGPILISQEWQAYARTAENPAGEWSDNAVAGRDYETFNALAYGADIVIPLISFGQESAWAPATTRSWWGWHMLWIEWVMVLVGWIVTAIGAAAVTGIIRRD